MKVTRDTGHQDVANEMVDLVFRHCSRFSASDETSEPQFDVNPEKSPHMSDSPPDVKILSSCVRPFQEEDNPTAAVSLLSAILVISARLPSPDFGTIENTLRTVTGNASPETVRIIVQKLDNHDAWWVVCRLVDGCVAVATRDSQLLPPGAFGALEALVSHCDAMVARSNTIALLAIRERLRFLRDVLEGRP